MTGRNYISKVPNRISPGAGDVIFNIHPKRNEEINDDGWTHREKGNINEIFPDCWWGHSHFFTKVGANAEDMPFNKMPEAIHGAKLTI